MEKCKRCGLNPNETQDEEQIKWEEEFIKENNQNNDNFERLFKQIENGKFSPISDGVWETIDEYEEFTEELKDFNRENYSMLKLDIPKEDINCRCTIAPIVKGEESRYADEEKRYKYWKTMDAKAGGYERAMISAYKRAFQTQQNAVMDILKEASN